MCAVVRRENKKRWRRVRRCQKQNNKAPLPHPLWGPSHHPFASVSGRAISRESNRGFFSLARDSCREKNNNNVIWARCVVSAASILLQDTLAARWQQEFLFINSRWHSNKWPGGKKSILSPSQLL